MAAGIAVVVLLASSFVWPAQYRPRTIERDGAILVSDAVVRVSRSCLKSFEPLLVSTLDWYVPTSHRGMMVFPRRRSVFWRLGVRPRDAISAIGGVSVDTPYKLLEAASSLKENESAPYEIRISRANGTTLRIRVESAASACQFFDGAKLL